MEPEQRETYPSRLEVSMKQRPSGSDEDMSMRSAGMKSSDSRRTTSPTRMSFHLRSSNVDEGASTLAKRAFSSESDWWRFYGEMRGMSKEKKRTDEVLLDFLECGSEQDDSEGNDSCVLVCGGHIRYLLDARGKEEEQVRVFRKLFWDM